MKIEDLAAGDMIVAYVVHRHIRTEHRARIIGEIRQTEFEGETAYLVRSLETGNYVPLHACDILVLDKLA